MNRTATVNLDEALTVWSRQEEARLASRPLREDYQFYTHARAVLVHHRAGDYRKAGYVWGTLRETYGECSGEAFAVWRDWTRLERGEVW